MPPSKRPPPATLARRWAGIALVLGLLSYGVADLASSSAPPKRPAPHLRTDADASRHGPTTTSTGPPCPAVTPALPGMPPIVDPCDIYSQDGPGDLSAVAQAATPMVYVPNSLSDTVSEIDPATDTVVRQFRVGTEPQHVVPSWDLKTLWVTNDQGNSLTPIDPVTGLPGTPVPVEDPYNLYFTPDGQYAIVVAEALHRLDFRNAQTMALVHSLHVPCSGVNHLDFSADGSYLIASCEFSGRLLKVNLRDQSVVGTLTLPGNAVPQDVKLSPDGKIFYVADLKENGVWEIDGTTLSVVGFVPTGKGAHGLYVSRDTQDLYVSNRDSGTISVLSFATRRVVATWVLPPEPGPHLGSGSNVASPDMGGVSADGKTLWLSGRYNADVYAVDTQTGQEIARVAVGDSPHGVCVWPQPGRYSLGHTDVMR
jgi:YVTN family beta-propeller protein